MNGRAEPRHWVVIPAAGQGTRMGRGQPKQYLPLAGEPLLAHVLRRFVGHPAVSGIVVALAPGDTAWEGIDAALREAVTVVDGGAERADSVRRGLAALVDRGDEHDWVLVHDAARPCLRRDDLDALLATLDDDPVGGILAVPARDTLKRVTGGRIAETVPREALWHAQTPQMFRLGLLRDALVAHPDVTDEAMAVERAGHVARVVEGHADNLKVTRPEDLALAAWYIEREVTARCA
ncbi:MAG: 2-C-methyl-D-erythritol 4-phosphate cytidylyltransferase [Gammaproteobacteria bacterium]|nr:2-C-methyl-D-erythritol 4-phosphate cytidylyltransferase [Gammaproteobacteria bacterium]